MGNFPNIFQKFKCPGCWPGQGGLSFDLTELYKIPVLTLETVFEESKIRNCQVLQITYLSHSA